MSLASQTAEILGQQLIFGDDPLPDDYLVYVREQIAKGAIVSPRMIHMASPFSPSAVLATLEFADDSLMHVLPGAFVDAAKLR